MKFFAKDQTMNTDLYLETMENHMLDFSEERGNTHFLQVGAPCHKSKRSMAWFQEKGIQLIDWPGNSPDLNPIENMWQIMKRKLEEKEVSSVTAMKEEITNIWENEIAVQYCRTLTRSMPNRLQAVLEAKGGPTKY